MIGLLDRWMGWSLEETNRKKFYFHPHLVLPMIFQIVAFTLFAYFGGNT